MMSLSRIRWVGGEPAPQRREDYMSVVAFGPT